MARHGHLLLRRVVVQTSKNLPHLEHGQNLLVLNLLWLNAGVLAAVAHLGIAAQLLLTAWGALAVAAEATHTAYLQRLVCRQLKL
jgi:hypothetical protein